MGDALDTAVLEAILADDRVVMLTTMDAGGRLRSRPMEVLEVDHDGTLWLFLDRSSQLCRELLAHAQVSVAVYRPDRGTGIAITGQVMLRDDPGLVRELWEERHSSWFPRGPLATPLVLLCIVPEAVRTWTGVGRAD